MESSLIGAIVISERMKSDFSHYDDEEEDEQVQGMIIEKIEDSSSTIYLVMDEHGKIYQTDHNEIERLVSFGGNPALYLKKEKEFKL